MENKVITTSAFKKMSSEETMKILEATVDGLSTDEAANRIKNFGHNEIPEIKKNLFLEFFKRYWGPMPWLLELAIVLTVVLKHYTESTIIFALLTGNAFIGYLQSQDSQKAVEMLKKKLKINAKVLRDGKWVFKY